MILFAGLITEFIIHRYTTNRSVVFRTEGNNVQIFKDRKWQSFAISAINMGPEKPSLVSGEMNTQKDEYARRFREAAAENINVIRVFTIQPPAFYRAFFEYNMLAAKPIYLLHGISIDGYSMNAYDDRVITAFFEEIRRTVDVIHGNYTVKQGSASGVYNLDISPYVMGYILNGDLSADIIISTNDMNTHVIGFEGDYLYTENATPWEAWFAGVGNFIISYEQDSYKAPYRLLTWINPTYSTVFTLADMLRLNWSDTDYMHIHATEKFNAGFFTSGHEYPTYPDLSS